MAPKDQAFATHLHQACRALFASPTLMQHRGQRRRGLSRILSTDAHARLRSLLWTLCRYGGHSGRLGSQADYKLTNNNSFLWYFQAVSEPLKPKKLAAIVGYGTVQFYRTGDNIACQMTEVRVPTKPRQARVVRSQQDCLLARAIATDGVETLIATM